MNFIKDFSFSALIAGFVTVLVGFTSSIIVVFQAAQALGATPEQIASWVWAICVGMGLTGVGLSLRYRAPIAMAWSTSGAALLITGTAGVSMPEAIGAFIVSGALMAALGFSGWFDRVMQRIPTTLASGMLAGVLLRFGMDAFAAMKTQFVMVCAMFVVYLLARRIWPRYAVLLVLLMGMVIALAQGSLHLDTVQWNVAKPIWVTPQFSGAALIGVALPLFIVTLTSQNVTGLTVLRVSGYTDVPAGPLIGWSGLSTTLLAPFGAYALNLATITAAICTGREAHEDPGKRYVAAVFASLFYLLVGIFGAAVGALFAAFPKELVLALAGFALLGTMGNGLANALIHERERESAFITFLVTASGVNLFGIGSAFWGLVAGVLALLVLQTRRR